MNPFYVKKKDETDETRSDNEDEYIPECITTSSSSRSSCLPTPKTPKPIAGIPVPRLELWSSNSESNSYSSDNDIEPGLNVKNIKVPILQDTSGQVLEYIEEINSMNEVLTMKVKSLNVHVQVLHSREDDRLNENNELKGTIKELTEELEHRKRSKRFNGNSFSQTSNKPAAAVRKVTNEKYDKTTRFVKQLESKNANAQLSNQKAGRIETTIATQTKKPSVVKISKTKAVKIQQKQTEVKITKPKTVKISPPQKATEVKVSKPKPVKIRQKQNDVKIIKPKDGEIPQKHVEVKISKPKAMIPQKLTDGKIIKPTGGKIIKPTGGKIIKPKDVEIPQTPTEVKVKAEKIHQKTYETVNRKSNDTAATITAKPQSATTKTLSSKSLKESRGAQNASNLSKSTLPTESSKQDSADKKISLPEISFSKNMSSHDSSSTPEIVTSRTRTTSNSTIHTDFNEFVYSSEFSSPQSSRALTPASSITEELSVYSCSSPELMIQNRFEGVHKTDKATTVNSTSSPDVSYSIKKISSVNSNHTIIRNVKKHGSLFPSLVEYQKINPENSATPPKIKSTSSVFESPQRRFKIAKKIGAAPQKLTDGKIIKPTDGKIIKPKDVEIPQTPTDVKVKAVKIHQKTYETVNRKSNDTAATITAKPQSATTKTLSSKSLKESRGAQNASKLSKSTLPTESSKQDSADKKISLPEISFSKNMSSHHSSSTPETVTSTTRTTSNSTIHTDFNEFVYSSEFSSPQSSRALTPASSITEELSVYSCSSPELMIQNRFEGVHKTDKATTVNSTFSPDVSYSIKKISSVNSNHTIIRNVKKHGSLFPSLVEYPKINPENSATPPKIKSTSSVFESPQRRFKIAKKIGAAPLPNPMKELPSLSGRYNPKPPASPRPNTKKIKIPSLQSQTKFYKRQD